jgi:hypothetical protein
VPPPPDSNQRLSVGGVQTVAVRAQERFEVLRSAFVGGASGAST